MARRAWFRVLAVYAAVVTLVFELLRFDFLFNLEPALRAPETPELFHIEGDNPRPQVVALVTAEVRPIAAPPIGTINNSAAVYQNDFIARGQSTGYVWGPSPALLAALEAQA